MVSDVAVVVVVVAVVMVVVMVVVLVLAPVWSVTERHSTGGKTWAQQHFVVAGGTAVKCRNARSNKSDPSDKLTSYSPAQR